MPPAYTSCELHGKYLHASNMTAQMPVVALAGQCDPNSSPVLIMVGAPNKMGQMSQDDEVE